MHDSREDILLTAHDLNGGFVGILIEVIGELIAAVVVKVSRVDIKDKLAVVGSIRLQAARRNRTSGFQLGEQVSVAGGGLFEVDVPCGALGDNIGVPIAVLFALVVLLGVANGLVRNGKVSDTGAVNTIISCQRASLLSRFIER